MKLLLTLLVFILALPVLAQDFPICRREREVARYKALARGLSNDEASIIVNNQARVYQLRKARRNEERVACNCDNNNPGLKDLLTFIEEDFSTVQQQLLGQTTAAEKNAAAQAAVAAYNGCESRERAANLRLLNEAKLSYEDRAPAGTTALSGFNSEGLRGFMRERTEAGQRIRTFAFAGSQTLFDWIGNVADQGGTQLKKALDLHLRATVEFVKNGGKIECTGHSLGGAIAEGFCAAVLRHIRYQVNDFGDYQKDNRIKVVTYNGLGAANAYKKAMGTTDLPTSPDSWLTSNTIHYRVDGDPLAAVSPDHLYGEVIEKASTRIVPKLGSPEASTLGNIARTLSTGAANLLRLNKVPVQADIRGPEKCEASQNPLEAHDLKSCFEITPQRTGWRESNAEGSLVKPQV